jgi:hypothetical protein
MVLSPLSRTNEFPQVVTSSTKQDYGAREFMQKRKLSCHIWLFHSYFSAITSSVWGTSLVISRNFIGSLNSAAAVYRAIAKSKREMFVCLDRVRLFLTSRFAGPLQKSGKEVND